MDPSDDETLGPEGGRQRRRPRMSRQSAVITAVGGVVVAALLFLVMVNVARNSGGAGGGGGGDDKTRREFVVGRAGSLAGTVGRRGPLLIQDPLRGRQNIYVQFLGDDRWLAFDSRAPGAPLSCQLRWRAATRDFLDACSGRTYPADGTGLVTYPTRVNDNDRVLVDLRSPMPPAPPAEPTTAPTTTVDTSPGPSATTTETSLAVTPS